MELVNMSGKSPEKAWWAWDLFPLHPRAVRVPRLWVNEKSIGSIHLRRGKRRLYVPTEADIALIESRYGDFPKPSPPWNRIEVDLVEAGKDPIELREYSAPVLLHYLKHIKDGQFRKSVRKPGRPSGTLKSNLAEDSRIYNDWKATGTTVSDFCRRRGLKEDDVRDMINRHKKRLSRAVK
jgi:hypothetical protein